MRSATAAICCVFLLACHSIVVSAGPDESEALDPKVTLRPPYPGWHEGETSETISLQLSVIQLARQAGLEYDSRASEKNVGTDVCRGWVESDFVDVPFSEAMRRMLEPRGLTYRVVGRRVILIPREEAGHGAEAEQGPGSKARASMPIMALPDARDWDGLWVASEAAMPSPRTIVVPDYPKGMEGREWLVVPTRYHELHFSPSADMEKVERLYRLIDNIFVFLRGRSPMPGRTPLRAFLVPGESRNSSCDRTSNAMRTGEDADLVTIFTSLLHEETHLFNFAVLGGARQNWWSGEYSCLYFQYRAMRASQAVDMKQHVLADRPHGPICAFGEIEGLGRQAFGGAFAAMYFLEKVYGRDALTAFRSDRLCLDRTEGSSAPSAPVFERAFGKTLAELDEEWRRFYGWPAVRARDGQAVANAARLSSGSAEPGSLAFDVVRELSASGYGGRAAGGPGERLAAQTIAAFLQHLDYAPVARGGYLRPFEVAYRDLVGPVGLWVGNRQFEYMKDFGVLNGGPATWVSAGVVCASYPDASGDTGARDGIEATGQILLLVPGSEGAGTREEPTAIATACGALAVILADPPGKDDVSAYRRKNCKVKAGVPVLHASSEVADCILEGADLSLSDLVSAADRGRWVQCSSGKACRLAAGAVYVEDSRSANVVGSLVSARSPRRYALLCAHYDGQGRAGDGTYYPSANDNASGVGVLLETARSLAQHRDVLPVSVIVAALGAEEVGLVGARALVKEKTVPFDQVCVIINLDMVGSGGGGVFVQRTATGTVAFAHLQAVADELKLPIKPLSRERMGSDAGVLQDTGITTLFFLTGDQEHHTTQDGLSNVSRETLGEVCRLLTTFILSYPPDE